MTDFRVVFFVVRTCPIIEWKILFPFLSFFPILLESTYHSLVALRLSHVLRRALIEQAKREHVAA